MILIPIILDISYEIFFSFFQGIKARILETFVMLFLLALLILGIVWVASALIDNDAGSMESLYGTFFKGFCVNCACKSLVASIRYLYHNLSTGQQFGDGKKCV